MTRRQPLLAASGLAVIVLIGVIVYFVAGGESDAGRTNATPSPDEAASFGSEEFAFPLGVSVPDGLVVYESREAVVISSVPEGDVIQERLVIFRTSGGAPDVEVFAGVFEDGTPTAEPWPGDFEAWLSQHPNFELMGRQSRTVAGAAATMVEARSTYQPPAHLAGASLRIILIGPPHDGTDFSMLPGEMVWRFVVFDDRELAIAYGAVADRFSDDRFDAITESLTLHGTPSGS
jgi:hypothetical protein